MLLVSHRASVSGRHVVCSGGVWLGGGEAGPNERMERSTFYSDTSRNAYL